MGFGKIKEKDGREKKREREKDIYCGPRIITEGNDSELSSET